MILLSRVSLRLVSTNQVSFSNLNCNLTNVVYLATIEFAMAYFKRGKCYMMMHDYKRALYDFSAAILNETRELNK